MMGQFVVADPAAKLNQPQTLASISNQEIATLPLLPDNFFLLTSTATCDIEN